MKLRLRMLVCGSMLLFGLAAPATAQYLRITTDNPADNTRLRATGTTILTITLNTNHDRSGSLQTCNSHQVAAGCPGAVGTAQPLDMFGYTLALKTVGGTVQWGTFTASDANYTNSSPQIQNNTEVEVNQFRPTGTFTPPGPATIGTIPVTILAGTPAIQLKVGYSQPTDLNPAGFGTGFATECDGTQNFNFYIVGDPNDPCGSIPGGPANGLAGDWFDWDGVSAPAQANSPPALDPIANMTIGVGGCAPSSSDQAIRATDPDGQTITFTSTGPSFMTVTSNPQVGNVRTGNIHLTSPTSASGPVTASVTATDGVGGSDTKSFTIQVAVVNQPPVLNQPANMIVFAPNTADQAISGADPCGAPLTFFKSSGPSFMTVTTSSATTGNIHLAPGFSDQGTFTATVQATNGSLSDSKSFTITVGHTDSPPALTQPANMTVSEGATANQAITARDAEADPITFSVVSGPAFMTLTQNAQVGDTRTGNINLAPAFSDAGTYGATIRVTDTTGASDSKSFTVTVNDVNRQPVLAQPANMVVNEGSTANQTLTASDPDGNTITFSKVSGPPYVTVATITSSTGNVNLAPGFSDMGTAGVMVRATDNGSPNLSDTKSFTITVNDVNRGPLLAQPANMSVASGSIANQTLTATDADGNAVTFSKVSGPTYVTVTTTSPGTGTATGNVSVAPGFSDCGTATVVVRATDNGSPSLSNDKSFALTVNLVCRGPVLNQPANMTVIEGATADQVITGASPDGDPLTFSKVSGPLFVAVTTTSSTSGNIHVAPGFTDAGTSTVTVQASDFTGCCGGSDSKSFTIFVLPAGNRCPTAAPGGPYSGLAGGPVNFDGTASSDPDGDPLTYAWDFDASDGITVDAVGSVAGHTYSVAGTFTVTLTVMDNGGGDPAHVCSDAATTTASIASACDVTVFNGYDTIRLGSGKPFWFAYVQPVGTCYNNSDVVIPSFVMKYAGRQITAVGKTAIGVDKSGDGIQEIKISFAKDDLRTLFIGTGLADGHNTVTVTLEANLVGGGRLSGTTQLDVVNNGSFSVAVSPNPLNPQATLTWTTSRAGFARIEMFDIQGRLVRGLVDEPAMAAGAHEATIDGRNQRGESLPSGVYFIRGTLSEGAFKRIITILK
jgi:PKD domain-containing protein/cadherin-like protein/Big-like domain-containing protein